MDDADVLKISIANINQYAVGLTGNQDPIAGNKTFTGNNTCSVTGAFARPITIKNSAMDVTSSSATGRTWIWITDANDSPVFILSFNQEGNTRNVKLRLYKSDGTSQDITLAQVV